MRLSILAIPLWLDPHSFTIVLSLRLLSRCRPMLLFLNCLWTEICLARNRKMTPLLRRYFLKLGPMRTLSSRLMAISLEMES